MNNATYSFRKLGEKVKRHRQDRNLSIEELSKKSGVNKNTIVRLEKGLNMHMTTVYKVCAGLGVDPLKIMDDGLKEGQDYRFVNMLQTIVEEGTDDVFPILTKGFSNIYLLQRLVGGALNVTLLEIKAETEWRTHAGDELLYAIEGTIGLRLGQKDNPEKMVDLKLETGKAVCFWGTEPHQYYNADPEKEKVTALSVWVDPEFKFSLKEA